MKKAILPIFLVSLLLLVAQTNSTNSTWTTEFVDQMAGLLTRIVIALIVFVAPLLLIYGFMKGTLDVVQKARYAKRAFWLSLLPLFTAQTDVSDAMLNALNQLGVVFMAFILILLPFTLILLMWKAFTKVVKL